MLQTAASTAFAHTPQVICNNFLMTKAAEKHRKKSENVEMKWN